MAVFAGNFSVPAYQWISGQVVIESLGTYKGEGYGVVASFANFTELAVVWILMARYAVGEIQTGVLDKWLTIPYNRDVASRALQFLVGTGQSEFRVVVIEFCGGLEAVFVMA